MPKDDKKRDVASETLIALRKAMGKTQQTFAVEVLKTAIGTIARYETSEPPRGEVLMRLSGIAYHQGLHELSSQFRVLYLEDVLKAVGSQVTVTPATETAPGRGYVTTSLVNEWAARTAKALLLFATAAPDSIPKKQQEALATAIEALETAAWMGTVFAKKGKTR